MVVVKQRGDTTLRLTLRRPRVGDALLEGYIQSALVNGDGVSMVGAGLYAELIKYTVQIEGLPVPFELPTRDSLPAFIRECFDAFCGLDEWIGDAWYSAVQEVQRANAPPLPPPDTSDTSTVVGLPMSALTTSEPAPPVEQPSSPLQ